MAYTTITAFTEYLLFTVVEEVSKKKKKKSAKIASPVCLEQDRLIGATATAACTDRKADSDHHLSITITQVV